jgi:hypothetical protein
MVRLGKKQSSKLPSAQWTATPAEILDVKYGMVHTTSTGVDAMYDKHSATRKLTLRVEPKGSAPYEATLKIERDGPATPDVVGTRLEVLVDPGDPRQLALPADPTFTLPGGRTWQPEHGLAGAIAAAARRGDAEEIQRLTSELHKERAPGASAGASVASTSAEGTTDSLDRLERLARLRDSGALTEAEFNAEKKKLLGDAS